MSKTPWVRSLLNSHQTNPILQHVHVNRDILACHISPKIILWDSMVTSSSSGAIRANDTGVLRHGDATIYPYCLFAACTHKPKRYFLIINDFISFWKTPVIRVWGKIIINSGTILANNRQLKSSIYTQLRTMCVGHWLRTRMETSTRIQRGIFVGSKCTWNHSMCMQLGC